MRANKPQSRPLQAQTPREPRVFDASRQPLGRLASQISFMLRGKTAPSYQPYILPETKVIVKNTDKVMLTGRKRDTKLYWRYTGFPGGMRLTPLKNVIDKDSRIVVRHAVSGMLAKNRLRSKLLKNLLLYKGEKA